MRRLLLVIAILTMLGVQAKADIISNGGFETGDFTDWTLGFPADDPSTVSPANSLGGISYVPHSGTYFAGLAWSPFPGNMASLDTLTQSSIVTDVGQHYTLSYWLASDGGDNNSFGVAWDSTVLVAPVFVPSTVVAGTTEYNQFSFDVVGTGSDTLVFSERNDTGYLLLDDVSLTPTGGGTGGGGTTPEPASIVLMGVAALSMAGYTWRRRRRAAA